MATNNASNTNNDSNTATIQEPPKKKRKKEKTNFWLVKVPTWVHDEWFNDKKYQTGARLAELYIIPNKHDEKKRDMKLEITRPPLSMNTNTNNNNNHHHQFGEINNPLKQFENVPIPTHFKVDEREKRYRKNVKHGELKTLDVDKLLVFHDKPAFPVGSKVEALDNSRNNNQSSFGSDDDDDDENNDDDENEDIDIKMNDKKKKKDKKNALTVQIKGYAKGIIKEINDDRTFTVEFNKTKKQRYQVPEKDIRFIDPNEAIRANKCKIHGVITGEMDVSPSWTKQYKDYLQIRAMKISMQKTMRIKEKVDVYKLDQKERDKIASGKITRNKTGDNSTSRNRNNKNKSEPKKKRVKSVRKDDKQYENMIFAAFEKDSCLTQKDIEQKCNGEKWLFLRPIVQKLCDRHNNTSKGGRSWVLKPEFRLATDTVIDDVDASNDQ